MLCFIPHSVIGIDEVSELHHVRYTGRIHSSIINTIIAKQ